MADNTPPPNGWPAHLRVGALRFVRSSADYEATIRFYRDLVGLPVIDEFRDSYGEDGTIFGLPRWPNHLEIVRSHGGATSVHDFDDIVFYLPDERAVEDATRLLRANGVHPTPTQHPYWEEWGGTTFHDPDGRKVIYVSWVYGPPKHGA
jgi:catechol 2,3-dioxygenase-like lactoylglutathione lyase family enzyme